MIRLSYANHTNNSFSAWIAMWFNVKSDNWNSDASSCLRTFWISLRRLAELRVSISLRASGVNLSDIRACRWTEWDHEAPFPRWCSIAMVPG